MTDLQKSGLKYLSEEVRLCMCGFSCEAMEVFHEALMACELAVDGEKRMTMDSFLAERRDVATLILYFMDRLDLIEHGGSVYGSWLSGHGRAVLAFLDRFGIDHNKWPEHEW